MKTKSIVLFVIGILLILAGIWFGAWLVSLFPYPDPFNFAAFMTGFVIVIVGFGLIVFGSIPIE